MRGDWDKADPDYRSWNAPPPQPRCGAWGHDVLVMQSHVLYTCVINACRAALAPRGSCGFRNEALARSTPTRILPCARSVATVPDDLKAYLEHKEAERRDAAETVLLALEAAGANGAPTLPAKPPKAPLEERVARYRRSVLRRAGLLDED